MGIRSGNPLLADIEDLLVEEACAEEDELLGRNDGGEGAKVIRVELRFLRRSFSHFCRCSLSAMKNCCAHWIA